MLCGAAIIGLGAAFVAFAVSTTSDWTEVRD